MSAEQRLMKAVRHERRRRKLSQRALGEHLGIDGSAVARMEKGQRGVSFGEAVALANLLDIDLGNWSSARSDVVADLDNLIDRLASIKALCDPVVTP